MLRTILIGCLIVAAAGCTSLRLPVAWKKSPEETTRCNMIDTFARIREYMVKHRDYPKDLSGLPSVDDHSDETIDGWGRPLIYSVDQSGVISLKSLGRDGKSGGKKKADVDIRRRYLTKNRDGTLNVDDEYWLVTKAIDQTNEESGQVDAEINDIPVVDDRKTDRTRTP
jgi:Type II secretion system (T2SS), protein G